MSKKIKTWRDPYDACFSTCRPKEVEIKDGITVLVGCNGAGKSTMLKNIKGILEKENIPYLFYDNQGEGQHSQTFGAAMFRNDFSFIAEAMSSSEGENISLNISRLAPSFRHFIKTGETNELKKKLQWVEFYDDEEKEKVKKEVEKMMSSKERWILLDAIDSGYSIDNVLELKGLFGLMEQTAKENSIMLYIIVSANEYELANGENCLDVTNGKYLTFEDYDAFRKFIIDSRKKKDKRDEIALEKRKKRKNDD